MKEMLEKEKPATADVVKHLDRCLSCLSCMTTCPSGVHYQHLVDHGRRYVEETYVRPLPDRLMRRLLALLLPRPGLFRLALLGVGLARPATRLLPRHFRPMLALAPKRVPAPSFVDRPQVFPAEGVRRGRVALLSGCAQRVVAPEINEATVRLLTRHGVEVVVARGAGCCGALVHHMGFETPAHAQAAANIRAWVREMDGAGLDAIVVNASGCGTTVKDYGFMFRTDDDLAEDAARIAAKTRDITEYLAEIGPMPPRHVTGLRVAYHSACSMQHGQKITQTPKTLLAEAGFQVLDVPEGHLCCGSAGTYNLLQPELATRLRDRKAANIESIRPQLVATGNVGCMTQIAGGTAIPVVHTVELLDWATGGPMPQALASLDLTPGRRAQAAE